MIKNDLINSALLSVKTANAQIIESSETPASLPDWVPGDRLQGTVIAILQNGRFQVLIDNHTLDMNLPKNIVPGDNIVLKFISKTPQMTFSLEEIIPHEFHETVNISQTARTISSIIDKLPQFPQERKPVKIDISSVLPSPQNKEELPKVLQQAIQNSGLFYESHLAQWVTGQKNIQELQQEPQAKLPAMASKNNEKNSNENNSNENNKTAINNNTNIISNKDITDTSRENDVKPIKENASKDTSLITVTNDSKDVIHPDTTNLVSQQLQVLSNHQMQFQVQLWHGQQMQWEIGDDSAQKNSVKNEKTWHSNMRLTLPNLGDIDATVYFNKNGVSVKINTSNSVTEQSLKENQQDLIEKMQSAGLKLIGVGIKNGD